MRNWCKRRLLWMLELFCPKCFRQFPTSVSKSIKLTPWKSIESSSARKLKICNISGNCRSFYCKPYSFHKWGSATWHSIRFLVGVCRTPMWSTRTVFRNPQFVHSESHWIAINVNVMSWRCDVTLIRAFANMKKDVTNMMSHRNSVFEDTSDLWLTVYFLCVLTNVSPLDWTPMWSMVGFQKFKICEHFCSI